MNITCLKAQSKKLAKTLNPLSDSSIEILKNEIFYYETTVHASVGIEVEYEIENTKIVQFHHEDISYKHKKDMEKGLSGADEATKTFAFKAKSRGTTIITIKELFRGDVKNTYTFKIIVK